MNVARHHITPENGEAPGRTPVCTPVHARAGAGDAPSGEHLPADLTAIDWRALRSRLFATHDRLGVLGEDAAATRLRLRGSFDGCAASALSAYEPNAYEESSRDINPDASSNGKSGTGKDSSVADVSDSGERG
ncbi:hypothetical protein [Novosphingobium resinovorum]|uniref:hypothetical protein n=1 Tax=Novosphingobium resinovorum TaxID=158500 RepID=UPI002ED1AD79|nr:hypothetical protein [Novosphingobium resinovorum]